MSLAISEFRSVAIDNLTRPSGPQHEHQENTDHHHQIEQRLLPHIRKHILPIFNSTLAATAKVTHGHLEIPSTPERVDPLVAAASNLAARCGVITLIKRRSAAQTLATLRHELSCALPLMQSILDSGSSSDKDPCSRAWKSTWRPQSEPDRVGELSASRRVSAARATLNEPLVHFQRPARGFGTFDSPVSRNTRYHGHYQDDYCRHLASSIFD